MKTRKVSEVPPCDFCHSKDPPIYDAPTCRGSWANMCEKCLNRYKAIGSENLGTCFILREAQPASLLKTDGVLDVLDETTLEDAVFDSIREVTCPSCGEGRSLEVDADCTFDCEGCGQKLRVKPVF